MILRRTGGKDRADHSDEQSLDIARRPAVNEQLQPDVPDRDDRASAGDAGDVSVDDVALRQEALLVEAAQGDPAAFGELYERYVDRVYAYIFHRVGNAQDAEDLTARTFYRALDRLETYENRGLPFSAWLFRIAHNLVANWHRDHSRRRFLSLDRLWSHGAEEKSPEAVVESEERHNALWSAINRLPVERRDLLLYKFSSRLSNVEIGQLMDKSESAVKSLYFRTLSSLRADLEARGWGPTTPDDATSAASVDTDGASASVPDVEA